MHHRRRVLFENRTTLARLCPPPPTTIVSVSSSSTSPPSSLSILGLAGLFSSYQSPLIWLTSVSPQTQGEPRKRLIHFSSVFRCKQGQWSAIDPPTLRRHTYTYTDAHPNTAPRSSPLFAPHTQLERRLTTLYPRSRECKKLAQCVFIGDVATNKYNSCTKRPKAPARFLV